MVVVGGAQTYSARANWKLLQENSADGYHAATTHSTYFDYIRNREGTVLDKFGKGFGRVRNLGNGHAVSESIDGTPWARPLARPMESFSGDIKQAMQTARDELVGRVGEERGAFICRSDRNLLIFPNLVVNDIMAMTVRTFQPVAPGMMEIDAWALAPVEETGDRLQTRLQNFLEFLGPGGFATPDDVEALESCQIGFAAGGELYNDISRGMLRHAQMDDELQMRTFWREWSARINGRPIDDWDDGPPSAADESPAPGWMTPAAV
jgi:p-cumate 2,3-dioxygenase alpha subunit